MKERSIKKILSIMNGLALVMVLHTANKGRWNS